MSAAAEPTTGSGFLDDVAIGALSPGVNKSTYLLLNVCFGLLLLPELFMLRYAIHKGEAIGHVCVLIVLSVGVFAAINWLISQIGLVSAEEQRESLGLGKKPAPAGDAGAAAGGSAGESSAKSAEEREGSKKEN